MHLSILKNFKSMEWDTERERERLSYTVSGSANKKKPLLEGNLVKQAPLKNVKKSLIQQFHF